MAVNDNQNIYKLNGYTIHEVIRAILDLIIQVGR